MQEDMHYHIRWSKTKLDWEPFGTREEAEQAARQLGLYGETFTVELVDDKTCMQCLRLRRLVNEKVREAECEFLLKNQN